MNDKSSRITLGGNEIRIESLVDLHTHWPLVRERLQNAMDTNEIEDQDLCKVIDWLVVLGEKTLFRID